MGQSPSSPTKGNVVVEKSKTKECVGALHIMFNTMFLPEEEINFVINPNTTTSTDILENIRDQLSEKEGDIKDRPASKILKKPTPMIQELKIISMPPYDYTLNQLPPDVTMFLTLKKLQISYNNLSTLPTTISQLLSLEYLQLDHNHLKSVPSEIRYLTSLKILNLEGNLLSSLPSISNLTQLQVLMVTIIIMDNFLINYALDTRKSIFLLSK